MSDGLVYLMYHELELPTRALCESEPGYVRYVVGAEDFRQQLSHLQSNNFRGLCVGEALALADAERPASSSENRPTVVITFDDGCETDLLVAAPLLQQLSFKATFYVTVAHLDQRGYLSKGQLRELSELGFEIGSHSMTHSLLSDLASDRLHVEIAGSKSRLEELIGKSVVHFSCPGGRWDQRVARIAREAGYDSVVTSSIGVNPQAPDRFRLSRVPVMRGMKIEDFERICRAEGLGLRRAQGAVLDAAKRVLGNSIYQRLRSTVLGQGA
ncbi:MAG TPA: polysaccharide deacetylase family protein [Pyrinomonadaceae bacterium]|jgi:peptidoglycan/xylan/chitin deacetylase (PgdA/CDA1 family)